MSKRIFSAMLALVMVFTLIPMSVFAETGSETEPVTPTYLAAYAKDVDVDGAVSEIAWNFGGNYPFDILWDAEKLYIAAKPGNATSVTFAAGDGSVTASVADGGVAEAQLPLAEVGVAVDDYGVVIPVTVTTGDYSWSGDVILTSMERIQKVSGLLQTQADNASNTTNLKTRVTADGGMRFTRLYGDGAETTAYDACFYKTGAAQFPELVDGLEYVSIEFDFVADAMPAYNEIHYVSGAYACHGFAASITDGVNNSHNGKPDCLNFGITNSNGDLYFMVGHGYDRGSTGTVEAVKTGFGLGETFHVQMLVDGDGNLMLYVDGQYIRTFENAVIDNYPLGSANSSSIPVVRLAHYGNPNTDGKKTDGSADVDFTVSNMVIGNTQGNSVLDSLTFDTIKGENIDPETIDSDLYLPTELNNPHLPDASVEWTSSDEEAISTDGAVFLSPVEKHVTLTATLAGTEISKSFELTIPAKTLVAKLLDGEITIDGKMDESVWDHAGVREFTVFNGLNADKVYALWSAGKLYLAITTEDVALMKRFEMSVGMICGGTQVGSVSNNYFKVATGDGVIEIEANLAEYYEIVMQDYNESYDFDLMLLGEGDATSVALESELISIIFSNEYYTYAESAVDVSTPNLQGATSGASTGWNAAEGAWKHTSANGGVAYWVSKILPVMDHTKDILTEIEMNITAAPVVTNPNCDGGFAGEGVYIWVTDCDTFTNEGKTTNGYYSFAMINNVGNGALAITNRTKTKTLPLGVNVGTKFTLGYLWKTDDSVEVFVNGSSVGTLPVDTKYMAGAGNDLVQVRARSTTATAVSVYIYDIKVSNSGTGYVTLEEELAPANVLKDVNITGLTNADTFTLPGSFETKLGTLTLTWEASNDYVTLVKNAAGSYTGSVHQPMTKVDVYTDLAMSANGVFRWTAEASVVGLQSGMETTADTLRVPFTAKDVVIDGATTDEGWSLDIKVLKNNAAVGVFGAQWDKDNLYMAVDTKGAALSVNINGVDVDLSAAKAKGNVKEFSVKLSALGVELEDYGEELTVKVTLGDAVWAGKFILTSTDWFLTDGVEPRIKVGLKGTTNLGSDKATENQGYEDLGNGWRIFDLYSPTGANPKSIRTYLILWARDGTEEEKEVFRPLNDRTTPTYTEFDFLAKSMPVYNPGNSANGATDWSTSFSNYGLTWNVAADSDQPTGGYSLSVSMGIYNSEEGLMFCVLGKDRTTSIPLGKFLGDQFRLGTSWNVDGSLTVYVDGVELDTIQDAESIKNAYGDESVVINLIRSPNSATSAADSFDIYLTNISVGKSRGNSIFDALSIEDILGSNMDAYSITSDLILPANIYDEQLDITALLEWTISEPTVVAQGGAVTRPENGGKLVHLTASWNGHEKTFEVYVKGLNYTSNTYVVMNDLDTAKGSGQLYDSYNFTLDTTNNSIILDQGSSKRFNLITLTDGDESNRLNESCLTIWVSADNIQFTQVKDAFKIKKEGNKIYLYDFVAEGRYVKVHCTHYLGDEADFTGPQEQMLQVEWKEYLDPDADIDSLDYVRNYVAENHTDETKYDEAILVDFFVAADNMVVYGCINDEWEHLYFYTEDDKVYVRIPEIAPGESIDIQAYYFTTDILNLQNKEYTLEVAYGTRETKVYDGAGRWVVELPDGRIMAINNTGDGVHDNHGWLTYCYSYNGGMTWTEPIAIECTVDWLHNAGGVTYDPNNGRIIVEGYQYKQFVAGDVAASDCKLRFVYSDDLGQTWTACPEVTFENNKTATYVLSYSDPVIVSSYDGEGPAIDMVLNNGVQYDDTGSFCCRVAYTTDAGKTWVLGDDEIRYTPGSGILAYEGGVSEGTILEVKDENGNGTGKLVLYARCQYDNVDVFCKAYSYDYGKNWTTAAELTDLYTVNTQPIMHEFGDAQLMFWGGNNVLGGNSYQRMPMNVAISYDGMESFVNIQDLYARYSLQGMTTATRNQIINQSVANQGDTVTLVWDNNFKETLIMRIDNFTDWFYRTKGIWDSFEHTTTKAEGWSTTSGTVEVSKLYAKEGNASMKIGSASSAVRSVPYLQNGTLAFDMYLFDDPTFQVELESAYGTVYGKAAPMGFTYTDGEFIFLGSDTAYPVALKANDWNNFSFQLDLDAEIPVAVLYVNGTKVADVPVNTEIGRYICWLDITTSSVMYVDCVYVDDNDHVEVPESPAEPTEKLADLPGLSANLTLNQTIDLNIYVPKNLVTEGCQIMVRKNGAPLSASQYTVTDKGTMFCITHNTLPINLYDIIGVQVVDAQGNPVSREALTSVRGYARTRLNNPLIPENERRMLIAMLDYGALAQLYVNADAGELANRYLENEKGHRDIMQNIPWPDTQETEDYFQSTGGYFSVNLTLSETIDINFFTDAANLENGNRVQLKVDGKVVSENRYTVTKVGQQYHITYSVFANGMCDAVSIQILDANGNAVSPEGGMSIRSYSMKLLESSDSNEYLRRMIIMMLDYGALAQIYSGNASNKIANYFITEEQRAVFENYEYPTW